MHRIFITGITGFIGQNLVTHFGNEATIELVGHSRDAAKAKAQFADRVVLAESYSAQFFNDQKIDTVIHLAGIAHDLSNQYKPSDYYQVNFENTKSIFNEFFQSDATTFIFLSSIKAAIDISSTPIDESVVPSPVTDYGKSKRQAEAHLLSVKLPDNKRIYILRPCMVHGEGNKGNLNLLYKFAKSGLPYPFGSFENQRSFLSIDNFNFSMGAFVKASLPSGIYHLADDGFLSTKELFSIISKQLGKTPQIWNLPASLISFLFSVVGKRGMLNKLTEDMMVNNSKLRKHLGKPFPVKIEEGIQKTIRSFDGR